MRARLLLPVLALLVLPAPAGAYSFQPERHRWETPSIPVWVGSASLRAPVRRAVADWNALRLRVRFALTKSRRRAFATLRSSGSRCTGGVTQVLGASQGGFRYIARARVLIAGGCSFDLRTFVVAHELGHVLGLGHESRRCALMNPSADRVGGSPQCARLPLARRAADPLRADDRAGARALYRRALSQRPLFAYERYFDF